MARVIITGLPALKKKLSSMSANVQKEVIYQVQDSSTQIVSDALAAAPTDLLMIGGSGESKDKLNIKNRLVNEPKKNGFAAEIGVQGKSKIPVYVEFGTGTDAASYVPTLPQEVQDYARQFYVNGKGRIKAQPYLIPAFLRESPIFIKELEKILKKYA
jgi:hypothetical protein